jgi:energy-coupling factor transporter ATP-binding protein EcfA2
LPHSGADEPTSSLTLADIEQLFTVLKGLRAKGHAIVYISHFLEEVKRIADNFTVLRDGRTVGSGVAAEHTIDEIVSLMIGRQLAQLYPRTQRTPGDVLRTRPAHAIPNPGCYIRSSPGEIRVWPDSWVQGGRSSCGLSAFSGHPREIRLHVHEGWADPPAAGGRAPAW